MRRYLPDVLTAMLTAATVGLMPAADAYAHGGTLNLEITRIERGRVEVTIAWDNDNDPVNERVAATVKARSSNGDATVGPWLLLTSARQGEVC